MPGTSIGSPRRGAACTPENLTTPGWSRSTPNDPSRVVVSTDVDPVAGAPLISGRDGQQHHELFAGRTADDGATWTWAAITADSDADNLRPLIPRWPGDDSALLWLRGAYHDYRDYDLDVVALVPWVDGRD